MPLSQKILRRQADVVLQMVRDTDAAVASGFPADNTLARFYRQHPEFGSRDRRLFSEVVFAYFRWKGWLAPPAAPDLAAACLLAHVLDTREIHPAMAQLAGDVQPPTAEGLPAMERRLGRPLEPFGSLDLVDKATRFALLTGTEPPSALSLVPAWFADLFRPVTGVEPAAALLSAINAFQVPPPTWLRIRGDSRDRVMSALSLAGGEPLVSDRVADAVAVPRGVNLRALSGQLKGLMEIQDLSSQIAGLICAPRPGERWWDACCGSGGKTLHLADLMAGRGRILATDVRSSILEQTERRLAEARAKNVETRVWDGTIESAPDGAFDGVLVDAPCSGIGTWHRNPDARWRMTRAEVERLAGVQSQLLATCARGVRPGGALVYATCTLTKLENDMTVARFLDAAPDFSPAVFSHPLDGSTCAGQAWIYPWQGSCNGMFVARLIRCR